MIVSGLFSLIANVICAGSKARPWKQLWNIQIKGGCMSSCSVWLTAVFLRLRAQLCFVFLQLPQQHELLLLRPSVLVFYSFIDPPKWSHTWVTFPLTQSWLSLCYIYFLYILYPTETPAGSWLRSAGFYCTSFISYQEFWQFQAGLS